MPKHIHTQVNIDKSYLVTKIDDYLRQWGNFSSYTNGYKWVPERVKKFQDWLDNIGNWSNKDTEEFLLDIWAVGEFPYRLPEILRSNTHTDIRNAFRRLISTKGSGQARIRAAHIPEIEESSLSEVLCFYYPNLFCIKNKRSKYGIAFATNTGQFRYDPQEPSKIIGVSLYDEMPYDEFHSIIDSIMPELRSAFITRYPSAKNSFAKMWTRYKYIMIDQFLQHWYVEYKQYLKESQWW